jgi:hypothetical protein
VVEEKNNLSRNRDIVHAADYMLAAPSGYKNIARGSGTWYSIRYAQQVGKKLYIIYPDGVVSESGREVKNHGEADKADRVSP